MIGKIMRNNIFRDFFLFSLFGRLDKKAEMLYNY